MSSPAPTKPGPDPTNPADPQAADEQLTDPEVPPPVPPEEEFWEKYNKRLEFPFSTVGAVLLHVIVALIIVGALMKMKASVPDKNLPVVISPIDGQVIAEVAAGGPNEVDEAVRSARDAFPAWAALGTTGRAELLHRLADLIEANLERLAIVECTDMAMLLESLRARVIKRGALMRRTGYFTAVDGVSFSIGAGGTLALVGESGCGKTTIGKAVLQLLRDQAVIEGSARISGHDLFKLDGEELRKARRDIQIVFQDPFASLNPRMRIAEILEEGPATLLPELSAAERRTRIEGLLERVGMGVEALGRYPHEFSGGQRQRLAIARALAVRPKLIICDEPTSALDVSVQAQILNLLRDLQRELGMSYLFITHNIGVVEYIADHVAVMREGRFVEEGPALQVLEHPREEYTRALLAAVPRVAS